MYVVVVGGAGWGPPTYLDYGSVWQVEVGNSGVVAIEPVKVILEVLLEAGELEELALVACLLGVLKEFIVMLVHWLIVVTRWLAFKSVNLCLRVGLKIYKV